MLRIAALICSRRQSRPYVTTDARVAQCLGQALQITNLFLSSLHLVDQLSGPVSICRVLCPVSGAAWLLFDTSQGR